MSVLITGDLITGDLIYVMKYKEEDFYDYKMYDLIKRLTTPVPNLTGLWKAAL